MFLRHERKKWKFWFYFRWYTIGGKSDCKTILLSIPTSRKLQSSGISSEIDFLKRIKLRAQILSANVAIAASAGVKLSADDITAVSFESKKDKRKKEYYAKLIGVYNASVKPLSTPAAPDANEVAAKLQAKM